MLVCNLVIWLVIVLCVVSISIGRLMFCWCRCCSRCRLFLLGRLRLRISMLKCVIWSSVWVLVVLVIWFMVRFWVLRLVMMLLVIRLLFLVSSICMVVLLVKGIGV